MHVISVPYYTRSLSKIVEYFYFLNDPLLKLEHSHFFIQVEYLLYIIYSIHHSYHVHHTHHVHHSHCFQDSSLIARALHLMWWSVNWMNVTQFYTRGYNSQSTSIVQLIAGITRKWWCCCWPTVVLLSIDSHDPC